MEFVEYEFSHKEDEFAEFVPVNPGKEIEFTIDFSSMGLPQPETKGPRRFVGNYD